ncbi:hypothetical protein AwWohl_01090 [Gammaproteobacteria bacterium]|nr:hypothetical protein AwWohl_01090 [Gammaproteobacteria bacterium]
MLLLIKRYIDTQSELETWCTHNLNIKLLGIDTEFMRTRTYFPKLCLIQLSTTTEILIIDPIKIKDLSALVGLFKNPNILKIIHSASQDIETLFTTLKVIPTPLFDTQIAASLLGFAKEGLLISYQEIVHLVFNIILEKDQTRTDWSKRPLTEAQLDYAFDDARFLIALHDAFQAKLSSNNHQASFNAQINALIDPNKYTPQLDSVWRKVKHKNKLKGRRLSLLKLLAYERELLAMHKNLPKRWVISDEILIDLAKDYGSSLTILDTLPVLENPLLNQINLDIKTMLSKWILKFYQSDKSQESVL